MAMLGINTNGSNRSMRMQAFLYMFNVVWNWTCNDSSFFICKCEANSVDANVSEIHANEVSAKPQPPTHLPDPDNLRDVLAYWVRLKRVEKGWSQERLALECELDRTYVSAVERSRWNVSLSNMERLARALGVEVWTLLRAPQSQNLA